MPDEHDCSGIEADRADRALIQRAAARLRHGAIRAGYAGVEHKHVAFALALVLDELALHWRDLRPEEQIAAFRASDADLVTAITMTHTGEAIGIARAAQAHGLPSVVSFTVETDGRLPSGEPLGKAIATVDAQTGGAPAYYMVNCAHPTHVDTTLTTGAGWNGRVRGLRANASTMSHAELDAAESLDTGDIEDLGARYAALRAELPQLSVLGGCCGTDARHIDAIRRHCTRGGTYGRGRDTTGSPTRAALIDC